MKGIPPNITQHWIELDILITLVRQARYWLNLNYVSIAKHDNNKLLVVSFIKLVEEAIWLSPVVVVPKKNGKLKICVEFMKLNVATKNDPYPLPFNNEVINNIVGHEVYKFLDGFSRYHQISITLED